LLKRIERKKLRKEKKRKENQEKRENKKSFKDFLKVTEYGLHGKLHDAKGKQLMKSKVF